MALTNIEVAQQACVEVGLRPIGTFDDGTTEAVVLKLHYETIVNDALARHYWRFGMSQVILQLLVDEPAGRWQFAFQLPPEVLAIKAVTVTDSPIPFDQYDDKIYANADNTVDVILDAMFNTVESKWRSYFTRYVVLKLAAILASGVREDASMSQLKEELANAQFLLAKNADSKGRTAGHIRATRITNSRLRRAGIQQGSIRANST